jgi:ribonuclease-3
VSARGDTADVEPRIGHRFARDSLLREALTHSSATGHGRRARRNNERLEFLGDRVLGLVVAELLIARFPKEGEGALSRRHAGLVRRETLAEVALALGLGEWLMLARSEEEGGGRSNPAILADATEALIGALFLDGGLGAAEEFIRRHFEQRLADMQAPPCDAKTALQEWAVAFKAAASSSVPGFVGGIVCRITPKSSLTILGPHLSMKVPPESAGESPTPWRLTP